MFNRAAALTILALIGFTTPSAAQPSKAETTVERTMPKSALKAILKRGPQRLIASVRVQPHSAKGRFLGFKLVGHTASSPLASSETIAVGDVILTVNGLAVERPDQFMRAWESIRAAKSLSIRVLRGDKKIRYRWTLVP